MRDEPIVARRGESPATASDPRIELEDATYHIYEANPAPWWLGLLWLVFFVGGAVYLLVNLVR